MSFLFISKTLSLNNLKSWTAMMRKSQCLLFVSKRSYIYPMICMTVPLNEFSFRVSQTVIYWQSLFSDNLLTFINNYWQLRENLDLVTILTFMSQTDNLLWTYLIETLVTWNHKSKGSSLRRFDFDQKFITRDHLLNLYTSY